MAGQRPLKRCLNMLNTIQKEERETELDLLSLKYKIEDLEFKRLRDLANQSMQFQLISLLNREQNLIQKREQRKEEDQIMFLIGIYA